MKQKIIVGIVVLATVALISGLSILAFASPGTEGDPFITLSYLTNIFRPQVLTEVQKAEQEMIQLFEERIKQLEAQLGSGQGGSAPAPRPADVFSVVTLRRGQSLTCSVGTEIMLRIGSVNGFGSAPALVNYTTGSTLTAGSALTANHMYLVTIEGNGITATADTVRVLVRGSYRLS